MADHRKFGGSGFGWKLEAEAALFGTGKRVF